MSDMMICTECGKVKHISEISSYGNYLCSVDGSPYYEDELCSCGCGGDFVEATICEFCGEEYVAKDGDTKFCDTCLQKRFNLDTCLKIGVREAENVSINGFFTWMLEKEEINEALKQYVRKKYDEADLSYHIKEYITDTDEETLKEIKNGNS